MTNSLARLLQPKSIAVIGGGAWCLNVIEECKKIGFTGDIWPVHPKKSEVAGLPAYADVDALPDAPDAAFVGVNRQLTVDIIRQLAARGAGGAVCFASGFQEAQAELKNGPALQQALLKAAGQMRILGPNCYGFVNALDGAALWPDQHGMLRVDSGVAILTQSSNIALNLTMQTRGVPIAYLGTVGNQAQTDLAELGMSVLDDPRVSCLGLHIEGIADVAGFEALARRADDLGKHIVALKIGASDQANAAAVSHTASLAGSNAGARALLARLGIAQVGSLAGMLEALKLLHCVGPLANGQIASMSCSGGEASLMADSVLGTGLTFPPLGTVQKSALRSALGAKVALANPLDYHTYIWGDQDALQSCFTAMMDQSDVSLGLVVLDFPRLDRCEAPQWDLVTSAIDETAKDTKRPMAVLASLPENMPEAVAKDLMARGVVPLCGVAEALEGIAAAAWLGQSAVSRTPVLRRKIVSGSEAVVLLTSQLDDRSGVLVEAQAKQTLAAFGLDVPKLQRVQTPQEAALAAVEVGFPVVLKGEGFAHKTEAGAVKLGLASVQSVEDAAEEMAAQGYLIEQMIDGAVVELLIGVVHDPAHGFVLTLGAGGVLTEILQDTVSMLLPVSEQDIRQALHRLRLAPLINGFRGAQAADVTAIAQAVIAVQDFVTAHADHVAEVEINPLLCCPDRAVAVDALIRLEERS